MSQVQINEYLKQLALLKKVSGEQRESIVREAFKDLLKGWGRQHDLVFIPEYSLDTLTKEKRYVDGALVYELRGLPRLTDVLAEPSEVGKVPEQPGFCGRVPDGS